MIAYQTDEDGFYVEAVECQESPLEPGIFLVPGGAVEVAPPELAENQLAKWDGSAWVSVDKTPEPASSEVSDVPEPTPPTYEELKEAVKVTRRIAYASMADPLFFGWQREENTKEEWLSMVETIKTLNPYPENPAE